MRSPSVRAIAKKLGISVETASLLSFLFNFAVIAGIIIWELANICRAHSVRHRGYSESDAGSAEASEEARRKLAEIERPDEARRRNRDDARRREKEAAAEESRIQVAAQDDARKMLESATQEIAAAAKAARANSRLTRGSGGRLAQKQIHVDAATDRSLGRILPDS